MTKTPQINGLRMMQVRSLTGVLLNVVDVPAGRYAGYPAARSKDRQVEFYDTRYPHTIFGQFTNGRYYVDSLTTPGRTRYGLHLDGDNRDWTISAQALAQVVAWLEEGN